MSRNERERKKKYIYIYRIISRKWKRTRTMIKARRKKSDEINK